MLFQDSEPEEYPILSYYLEYCAQQSYVPSETVAFEPTVEIPPLRRNSQPEEIMSFVDLQLATTYPSTSLHEQVHESKQERHEIEEEIQEESDVQQCHCSRKMKRGRGSSFNTMDYIIRHCLKRMLDSSERAKIEQLCQEYGCSYQSFLKSWNRVIGNISAYIGIGRMKQMIKASGSEIEVGCHFLEMYLSDAYVSYVRIGRMENKEHYLNTAAQLLRVVQQAMEWRYRSLVRPQKIMSS